ncbi:MULTISPECIES: hypothetical protein [Saccharothrix]|uniref:hypothetical protein n=1 Tax=Saccharothrix TaxID=2071 RepID=UPI00093C2701|nr:hypothetical protein [Saccharothrix sp. CB00851]OKI16253.1 hypothetical protein A6A25_13365 [Saccharothrix sp. CB00851]
MVSAGAGVGTAAGPAVGGLVGQWLGWPALSWIMLVVALVLVPPALRVLPDDSPAGRGPIDIPGGILLGLGAGLVLGIGFILVMTTLIGAAAAELPGDQVGVGLGVLQGVQFLGAGTGPAVFGVLVSARLESGAGAVNPFYPRARGCRVLRRVPGHGGGRCPHAGRGVADAPVGGARAVGSGGRDHPLKTLRIGVHGQEGDHVDESRRVALVSGGAGGHRSPGPLSSTADPGCFLDRCWR